MADIFNENIRPTPNFTRRFAEVPDHSIEVPPPQEAPDPPFINRIAEEPDNTVRFVEQDGVAICVGQGRMTVSAMDRDIEPGTVVNVDGEDIPIHAFVQRGSEVVLPYYPAAEATPEDRMRQMVGDVLDTLGPWVEDQLAFYDQSLGEPFDADEYEREQRRSRASSKEIPVPCSVPKKRRRRVIR